ncbi:MAG: metallophosphoesterase [Ruminococcus sp.]|nr:metallophosphoesterase [Ruminococcus sp.]
MFWIILFLTLMLLAAGGVIYLIAGFHRFSFIRRLGEKHRLLAWGASMLPVAALAGFAVINWYTVIVVVLHLMVFWLLADFIGLAVRKLAKKPRSRNIEGACAILFTAVYLAVGWQLAHDVRETDHTIRSDKLSAGESLRIAVIADSHLGITLDGEGFEAQIDRIQDTAPDMLVIVGDYVDDDTTRSDMVRACEALGGLKTTYGVYFVYGNHDKGYYDSRDFTADELSSELTRNGVTILEDEVQLIGERFCIIGRQDGYTEGRAEMSALMEGIDSSRYTIVLDHQPNDYDAEAAAGADLVLSGHTHGGPLFPAGQIGVLTGQNDRFKGSEVRGGTTFIVTSGISGWAIPFKTGTQSEFVVVDIAGNA